MKDLILVGGGGHCKSCIESIEQAGQYNIIGILDTPDKIGSKILKYKVVGTDDDILKYLEKKVGFCITIGQISASSGIRIDLFSKINIAGGELPVIISPFSTVSRYAELGIGTVVLSGVIINPVSKIGQNCIINSKSLIEHDVKIGDNCHISTGAVINGNCIIGSRCMIGSGAILKNGISIPDNTMIGMGAVVTKSIKTPGVYVGNPARRIR